MQHPRRAAALARCALLLAFAAACTDQPLSPRSDPAGAEAPTFSAAGRAARDVPAVRIDLPPAARPWDTDAGALAQAVGAVGGYATVGVKEPGSARALATGNRGAVTAGTVNAAVQLLSRRGVEIVEVLDAIGVVRVRIAPEEAAALKDHPLIDFIEPRQYATVQAQTTPWGITKVAAPDFWSAYSVTGAGARVLIIDTGHQQNHPDLPAVPSANCAGAYGGCDDGSGAGWHGTHVLGIVAARSNTVGVVGVAPGIAGSDVYVYGACDSATGSCALDQVAAGINAGIWNAQVINLSLSGPYDAAQATAVAQAWSNGIVIVAAAGNNLSNTLVYPAALANVVGVSGVNSNESFAGSGTTACGGYSNYGSHVDLAAPFDAYSTIGGSSYGTLCGTSMAAPHVTGVAALLRSQNPGWTNQQVVDTLFARAKDLGAAGKDVYFGYGLVRALRSATPPAVIITGPMSITSAGTYTWQANASGGNGTYTYAWEYRVQGSSTWTAVGTGSSYSRAVATTDAPFELRVTVASAGLTGSDTHLVGVTAPPTGTLAANITGPTSLTGGTSGTWNANATGGSGSYTYTWDFRKANNATWTTNVGTGSSYTRNAPLLGSFYLRVTVTSNGSSVSDEHYVYVEPAIQEPIMCGQYYC
jgi:subtilisin family serine protease